MGALGRIPIRWRLASLTAGLTFIVLLAFAMVIGQLTTSRIRSDFNNEVVAAVDDLRDRLELDYANATVRVSTDVGTYAAPNHAAIRVLNARSGLPMAQSRGAPNFGLPGVGVARTDRVGDYRVESRRAALTPVNVPKGVTVPTIPVFVQYGRRVSDVEETISRVRLFLLLGVLVGTGLALAGALVLSRRALAPITKLTATARDVERTRDPGTTVPVPESGDEVAELARTLNGMLEALEGARGEREQVLARQRQFVADASHELRTPLTSVLANLELLTEVLDGERGEAARSALRSTQRMRRLVADLLLLARADARRGVARQPTDLGRLVVEAAGELGPVAAGHLLSVEVPDEPALVSGARDDLYRVALNLMENAIKHTPSGTTVQATVTFDGPELVLVVSDDGPGVPEGMRAQLFDRFVRAGGDGGASFGLGLSIVRAVARAHGGDVTLRDGDAGAVFEVRLPRLTGEEPARADDVPADRAPEPAPTPA